MRDDKDKTILFAAIVNSVILLIDMKYGSDELRSSPEDNRSEILSV
jgi:hypothetical protein